MSRLPTKLLRPGLSRVKLSATRNWTCGKEKITACFVRSLFIFIFFWGEEGGVKTYFFDRNFYCAHCSRPHLPEFISEGFPTGVSGAFLPTVDRDSRTLCHLNYTTVSKCTLKIYCARVCARVVYPLPNPPQNPIQNSKMNSRCRCPCIRGITVRIPAAAKKEKCTSCLVFHFFGNSN